MNRRSARTSALQRGQNRYTAFSPGKAVTCDFAHPTAINQSSRAKDAGNRENSMSSRKSKEHDGAPMLAPVAGNGLVDRRALLGQGIALAGAATTAVGTSLSSAAAEPLTNGAWSLAPGVPVPPYGQPSKYEANVVRATCPSFTRPAFSHSSNTCLNSSLRAFRCRLRKSDMVRKSGTSSPTMLMKSTRSPHALAIRREE